MLAQENHICQEGANADAIFYPDNGSVEIAEGSILSNSYQTADKYPEVEAQRQELIDEGIIEQIDNDMVFVKSYIIYPKRLKDTALSTATQIILHGTRKGWEWWLLENGEPINTIRNK